MKDKKPRGALKAAALVFALAGMTGIGAQAAILTQNLLIYSDVLLLASFYILYQAYVKCLMHRKTRGFYFLTVGLSVCYSFFLIWGGLLDKDLELPLHIPLETSPNKHTSIPLLRLRNRLPMPFFCF